MCLIKMLEDLSPMDDGEKRSEELAEKGQHLLPY